MTNSTVESKVDALQRTTDRLVKTVEEIGKTLSKMDALQTEVNHIDSRTTKTEANIEQIAKEIVEVKVNQAVSSEAVGEFKKLRTLFLVTALGVVFAGGFSAYMSMSQKTDYSQLVEQQIKLLEKISQKGG